MKHYNPKHKALNIILSVAVLVATWLAGPALYGQANRNRVSAAPAAAYTGYFVSTTGNDANPGTEAQPWRTINKGVQSVGAGATLYIRGGVYSEQVTVSNSGTQSAPINILAYPGETPVIDGANLSMASWSTLLTLSGNWINVTGLEVRNSKYIGIFLRGQHDMLDKVYAHHNQENGILIGGDYGTVQNSKVYRNALSNEYGKASSWAGGLNAARDPLDGLTSYAVIRNNTVWENWGEGISSYEASGTLIEGNVSHDNFSTNIYLSDTTNVVCQRNFVYMDPSSYVFGYGSNVGIMMGDEKYTPASSNIKVLNNIAFGNNRNFYWWQGVQGGGMNNVLIANNTFVNGVSGGNVVIAQGPHVNVRFQDNIVQQDSSLAPIIASTGVTYSYNLWSKTPSSTAAGTGDYVGDPRLLKSGSQFLPAWYQLADGSPAIDKALALSDVTVDYYGNARGSAPDKGSIEKSATTGTNPTPTTAPTIAPQPSPTPTKAPTTAPTPVPTTTVAPTAAPTTAPTLVPATNGTYYVATNGSDSNPGSQTAPFRTINKAVQVVSAGGTIYVRAGVYAEQVVISKSGTQSTPIKVMSYPGETAVIDGTNLSTASGSALVSLTGSWINLSGLEVRASKSIGVNLRGQHNTASSLYVHHNRDNGILLSGDYSVADGNRVYRNSLSNENGVATSWTSGISAGGDPLDGLTSSAVIRNNTVWENWGDGISTYASSGTLIQGNTSYSNSSAQVFISDSTGTICTRNFLYMDPASYVYNHGDNIGIEMGDLKYNPTSANIRITNNIVTGNRRNFYWWQGPQGGGMNGVLIANNTFVNSTYSAGLIIAQGTHQSSYFMNNIVEQDDSLPIMTNYATSGIKFSFNLWSKTPPSSAAGTNSYVAAPLLAKTGSQFTPGWYTPTASSPAMNKAVYLTEVTDDFYGKARSTTTPDIGAVEQ